MHGAMNWAAGVSHGFETTERSVMAGGTDAVLRRLCIDMHKRLYGEGSVMNISALVSMLAAHVAAKNTLASYS
jgi:hypothetical protein